MSKAGQMEAGPDGTPGLMATLRLDAARYDSDVKWYRHPGFRITAVYRLGQWAQTRHGLGRLLAWIMYRLLRLPYRVYNAEFWAGACSIGPGLLLIHPTNLYVAPGSVIGKNCTLHHEITLGWGTVPGVPRLGDDVIVYPGARLLGGITVGDGAMIGANCVVSRNVPPGHVVIAPSPRMIPRAMSAKSRSLQAQRASARP